MFRAVDPSNVHSRWKKANGPPTRAQGEPIDFESDMFAGRVMMWVKGLPSAAPDLFKGKRRRTRITVQGRFKAGSELR